MICGSSSVRLSKRNSLSNSLRLLPAIAVAALVAGASFSSCSGDDDKVYADDINPKTTPTMTTHNVSTLISDSGVTRYRVAAPVWYIFDESDEPQWTFPQSLHLERYDDFFNKEATVDCDSATYFRNRQLWRLDGNVAVVNMAGERFLTQQLFWDQRKQSVYSDSFIQIIRADRIMEGYGFESNENMSRFHVKNVSAILPVEQFKGGTAPGDSTGVRADSVRTSRPQPQPTTPADTVRPQPPAKLSQQRHPQRPQRTVPTQTTIKPLR